MPPVGFKHAITASERPHTHVLDRAVIGISYEAYKREYTHLDQVNQVICSPL